MLREVLGVRELLKELGVALVEPMPLRVYNQAVLKPLGEEGASAKAKHVDVRIKFVIHHTKEGVLVPEYRDTEHIPADVLTKAVAGPRMNELRAQAGLH